jgi:energy-coupling factor transporter ATP-binding protein EcfA2
MEFHNKRNDDTPIQFYNYKEFSWKEFFISDFRLGNHVLILGDTGSGKSNLLLNLYKYCPYKIVFFNTMGLIEFNKLSDVIVEDVTKFQDALNNDKYKKISIQVSDKIVSDEEALILFYDAICKTLYFHKDSLAMEIYKKKGLQPYVDYVPKGNLVFIVDEVMLFQDASFLTAWNKALLTRGRNYKISFIGASQRNQNIGKIMTTQCKIKFLFPMDDYDIDALRNKVAYVEFVPFLEEFHFIYSIRKNKSPMFCKPVELLTQDW